MSHSRGTSFPLQDAHIVSDYFQVMGIIYLSCLPGLEIGTSSVLPYHACISNIMQKALALYYYLSPCLLVDLNFIIDPHVRVYIICFCFCFFLFLGYDCRKLSPECGPNTSCGRTCVRSPKLLKIWI